MAGAKADAQQAAGGAPAAAAPALMTQAEAAATPKVGEADVQGLTDGGKIKAKKMPGYHVASRVRFRGEWNPAEGRPT